MLSMISWRHDWNWQTAERELLYSLELCPNGDGPHYHHALYLAWNRRDAEALAEMAKCHELDPVRSEPVKAQAAINYHFRNHKALIDASRSFTALSPNAWLAHYLFGVGYEGSGQPQEAILQYLKAVE